MSNVNDGFGANTFGNKRSAPGFSHNQQKMTEADEQLH